MRLSSITFFAVSAYAAIPEFEIREWHFHPYFFQGKPESLAEGRELYNKVIAEIKSGNFFAVVDGVQDYYESIGMPISPDSWVGGFDEEPVGPHPMGQFQLWVPTEYFGQVWSFMTENRGSLTILLHPLTGDNKSEHSELAMWQGGKNDIYMQAFRDDATVWDVPKSQFPELGLGYAGNYTRPEPEHHDDIEPTSSASILAFSSVLALLIL